MPRRARNDKKRTRTRKKSTLKQRPFHLSSLGRSPAEVADKVLKVSKALRRQIK